MTHNDPDPLDAWLLLDGPADAALGRALAARGVLHTVDVAEPAPPARLGVVGGRPALWGADLPGLFARVRDAGTLWAFAAARADQLRGADGAVFRHDGRGVRLRYEPAGRDEPYARRFVRLEWAGVAPPDRLVTVNDVGDAGLAAPRLFVDPPRVKLAASAWADWLDEGPSPAGPGAWLVPPCRTGFGPGSYFEPARRRVRRALAAAAGVTAARGGEPAVLTLWRWTDDPALRDLLAEGAALRPTDTPGAPTAVRLEVPPPSDPVAAYRVRHVVEGGDGDGPGWAREVSAALRADLLGLSEPLTPGLPLVPATVPAPYSWSVEEGHGPHPSADAAPLAEGSWQRIAAAAERLDAEGRADLWRWVLAPTAPGPGRHADHDRAERLWLDRHARAPWPDGPSGPWRYAAVAELLRHELTGTPRTPESRFGAHDRGEWVRLDGGPDGRLTLGHAPAPPRATLRWRLSLPLGATLTPAGPVRLDGTTPLDGGYSLA